MRHRARSLTARRVVVPAVLAGAGLAILAATRGWAGAAVTGVPGTSQVTVSGTDAAPGVVAAALVVAAGAVVLAIAGRAGRLVAAVVIVAGAAGIVLATLDVMGDPAATVAPAVSSATGILTDSGTDSVAAPRTTAWPWLAVAGGAVAAVTGALGLIGGRSWPATGRRFEVPAGGTTAPDTPHTEPAAQPAETWDALSRGDDPT